MTQGISENIDKTKTFSPKGRFGRARFSCWGTVFLMLPRLISSAVPIGMFIFPVTFTFYIFAILKRLRDIGLSPWWALLAWLPVINIPLFFIPGNKGENKYGVAPRLYKSSELIFAIFLPLAFSGLIITPVLPQFQKSYEYYKQRAESEKKDPHQSVNDDSAKMTPLPLH